MEGGPGGVSAARRRRSRVAGRPDSGLGAGWIRGRALTRAGKRDDRRAGQRGAGRGGGGSGSVGRRWSGRVAVRVVAAESGGECGGVRPQQPGRRGWRRAGEGGAGAESRRREPESNRGTGRPIRTGRQCGGRPRSGVVAQGSGQGRQPDGEAGSAWEDPGAVSSKSGNRSARAAKGREVGGGAFPVPRGLRLPGSSGGRGGRCGRAGRRGRGRTGRFAGVGSGLRKVGGQGDSVRENAPERGGSGASWRSGATSALPTVRQVRASAGSVSWPCRR